MGTFAWFAAAALAGGTASPPPPTPPAVDFAALPVSASARPESPDPKQRHPVQVRVMADRTAVEPGGKLRLGVLLEQDAGWHTYWRTPGDIGQPTDIAWSLPAGVVASPHIYAVPQRFEDSGLVSYGYEERSFLISDVTVPAGLTGSFDVKADVAWLVCQSSCIPGNTTVAMSLPVGPGGPSAQAPLFEHFAAQHPVSPAQVATINVETALMASAVHPESPYCVAILVTPTDGKKLAVPEAGTWPLFTSIVEPAAEVYPGPATVKATPDGGFVAVVTGDALSSDPLPAKTRIGGLLQLDIDGKRLATEVLTDLPWVTAGAATTRSESPVWAVALAAGAIAADAPCRAEVTVAGAAGGPPTVAAATPQAPPPPDLSLLPLMLGMAFLGGLLLNVMPCVLPVLTLKVYGLVEDQELAPRDRRNAGLAYTAGVLVSFWVLAAVVLILQATIGGVGWGFQFQYPAYVAVLGAIVFAFGLSMFGVFEIPAIGADQAGSAAAREGLSGHFLTGVFATLLGTPCSAPFLGPAVGFAFALPMWALFVFFSVIALGLAFPFLMVAAIPAFARVLPRPGAWMITFKNLMGFTLIGTTVWLVDVLGSQTSPDGVTGYLAFLTVVGFAAWLFGHYGGLAETGGRQVASLAAALGFIVGGWLTFVDFESAPAMAATGPVTTEGLAFTEEIPWQKFSDATVTELRTEKAMFIDFTAEWCLTCKVNENTVLETDDVRQAMARLGVIPLKADWTKRDPEITSWLQRYGRAGVPFYVVIPKCGGDPIPLSEIITTSQVIAAMETAAAPCGPTAVPAAGAP